MPLDKGSLLCQYKIKKGYFHVLDQDLCHKFINGIAYADSSIVIDHERARYFRNQTNMSIFLTIREHSIPMEIFNIIYNIFFHDILEVIVKESWKAIQSRGLIKVQAFDHFFNLL